MLLRILPHFLNLDGQVTALLTKALLARAAQSAAVDLDPVKHRGTSPSTAKRRLLTYVFICGSAFCPPVRKLWFASFFPSF